MSGDCLELREGGVGWEGGEESGDSCEGVGSEGEGEMGACGDGVVVGLPEGMCSPKQALRGGGRRGAVGAGAGAGGRVEGEGGDGVEGEGGAVGAGGGGRVEGEGGDGEEGEGVRVSAAVVSSPE